MYTFLWLTRLAISDVLFFTRESPPPNTNDFSRGAIPFSRSSNQTGSYVYKSDSSSILDSSTAPAPKILQRRGPNVDANSNSSRGAASGALNSDSQSSHSHRVRQYEAMRAAIFSSDNHDHLTSQLPPKPHSAKAQERAHKSRHHRIIQELTGAADKQKQGQSGTSQRVGGNSSTEVSANSRTSDPISSFSRASPAIASFSASASSSSSSSPTSSSVHVPPRYDPDFDRSSCRTSPPVPLAHEYVNYDSYGGAYARDAHSRAGGIGARTFAAAGRNSSGRFAYGTDGSDCGAQLPRTQQADAPSRPLDARQLVERYDEEFPALGDGER